MERGHLPAGLDLQNDGTIRGRAEVPGEYWFDVSVKDSSKSPRALHQSFLLRVSSERLAVITSNSELPWARAGSEYLVRLTAAGRMPPFFWKAEDALPRGMKLSAKGVLSGAPEQGGDFHFAVLVRNLGSGAAQFLASRQPGSSGPLRWCHHAGSDGQCHGTLANCESWCSMGVDDSRRTSIQDDRRLVCGRRYAQR